MSIGQSSCPKPTMAGFCTFNRVSSSLYFTMCSVCTNSFLCICYLSTLACSSAASSIFLHMMSRWAILYRCEPFARSARFDWLLLADLSELSTWERLLDVLWLLPIMEPWERLFEPEGVCEWPESITPLRKGIADMSATCHATVTFGVRGTSACVAWRGSGGPL